MTTEDNGNVGLLKPTSSSNEDLSEYTDADESISAPTEVLAEFLSAVMMKDYVTALKYCKLILQYEPNNPSAKEFYPLILEKLQQLNAVDDGSTDGSDGGEDEVTDFSSSSDSDSSSSSSDSSDEQEEDEQEDGVEVVKGSKGSKGSSDGDATTGSYSSLEDDEAETVGQLAALTAKYRNDNVNLGNGNKLYNQMDLRSVLNENINKASMSGGNFSLIVPQHQNNQTLPQFGTSSDSESPTDPVSQDTVQILRAKVVPAQKQ